MNVFLNSSPTKIFCPSLWIHSRKQGTSSMYLWTVHRLSFFVPHYDSRKQGTSWMFFWTVHQIRFFVPHYGYIVGSREPPVCISNGRRRTNSDKQRQHYPHLPHQLYSHQSDDQLIASSSKCQHQHRWWYRTNGQRKTTHCCCNTTTRMWKTRRLKDRSWRKHFGIKY